MLSNKEPIVAADSNPSVLWQPLSFGTVVRQAVAGCRASRRLLLGWAVASGICLLLARDAVTIHLPLPAPASPLSIYIHPPMLISQLLLFALGLEWALLPVFFATLLTCLGLGIPLAPAILVAMVNPVGLALLGTCYWTFDLSIDLRSWRARWGYLAATVFATLVASSGAFPFSAAIHAKSEQTWLIWEGWVLGSLASNVSLIAPPLFLFAGRWYGFRNRVFEVPPRRGIPFRVLVGIISGTGAVLISFLGATGAAATERLEAVLERSRAGGVVEPAVWDAVANWRLSAWSAVGVVLVITGTALFVAYWWSQKWEQQRCVLAEAMGRAQAALDVKSSFLATVSHELRTPMNGILGMHELLLTGSIDGEARRYAQIAEDSAQHLLALLNELLDLSKTDAGKLDIEQGPFDLRRQIELAANLVRPKAQAVGLELSVKLDPAIPAVVVGDAQRFRQVLLNLAGNAVKFTARGTVSITATLSRRKGTEALVRVAVADTGPGIAQDVLPRLFQPFSQGDESLSRAHGGTGLGLAISRQLIERMGGSIEVESDLGKGSTFRFLLPFVVEEQAGEQSSESPAEPALAPPVAARVLVAEDNPVNQLVARRFLERIGCKVDVVDDGFKAVEMCARCRYDLVLMDCQMPGLDGLDATRKIRAQEPANGSRTPILAMTAHAGEEWRERCFEAGMEGFVTKPISFDELSRVLRRWLRSAG